MSKLILFVGLPGSGKTTFYESHRSHFPEKHIYLSLDRFRKLITGQDYVRNFEPFVKSWIDPTRLYLLDQGVDVVFDATNVSRHLRMSWIQLAKEFKYEVECYYFNVSWQTLLERDEHRAKSVGSEVLRRMSENFEEPTLFEGFDAIHEVKED